MPEIGLVDVAMRVEEALANRRCDPVAPPINEGVLADRLASYDFAGARPLSAVIDDMLSMLRTYAVRSDHPRYFGLFNPPALPAAIAGDLVGAAINPQLAVWSHAPAAAEIERKLLHLFGALVWPDIQAAGTFTSGGTEANQTALLAALARRYPGWADHGLPNGDRRPAIYASTASHLAWVKLARMTGLGADAVRLVPAEKGLAMRGRALSEMIAADDGFEPVLVVATAGTTGHGSIDDIAGIVEVGRKHHAWTHVDAAWAGAALLHPKRRHWLAGIGQADSVTIDPHKWLSVPMGAGLFLARDWAPLAAAFAVSTSYMPSRSHERRDAYIHSVQWSRRFIGGKLFTALATLGLPGYRALIDRAVCLADRLRAGLAANRWKLMNDTPLPLVCFVPDEGDDDTVRAIEARVVASGQAWISTVRLGERLVLRACITSYESGEADVDALLDALHEARLQC